VHDLRHAFASLLVNAETNPRVVADLLGHRDVSFTLATYFHPDEHAASTPWRRPSSCSDGTNLGRNIPAGSGVGPFRPERNGRSRHMPG